jgi:hypothetical protein
MSRYVVSCLQYKVNSAIKATRYSRLRQRYGYVLLSTSHSTGYIRLRSAVNFAQHRVHTATFCCQLRTAQGTNFISTKNINSLILYTEIMSVCLNRSKHSEQNTALSNIKHDGTFSYHSAL